MTFRFRFFAKFISKQTSCFRDIWSKFLCHLTLEIKLFLNIIFIKTIL